MPQSRREQRRRLLPMLDLRRQGHSGHEAQLPSQLELGPIEQLLNKFNGIRRKEIAR